MPSTSDPKKIYGCWYHGVLALCLFLVVLGAKWATVDRYGSDLPNWDQWDAEGLDLLGPWFEKDQFIAHLFKPHNEHRIVLTKVQNLAATLIGGQWDARLETMVNAALHASLAATLWLAGRRWLAARWSAPLFVVLAALFGLPFAWQNVTGGFHSQQYWLLGLSFAAIVCFPFARAFSGAWWVGALLTILALFTMGSGLFAAAIVIGVVVVRRWRREVTLREVWPTFLVAALVVAAGWWTRVEVVYHTALKAKTVDDFVKTVVHNLQWPISHGFSWHLALLLWAPWALVTWQALRLPAGRNARIAQSIAALGGWVILQVLATAYARGAGGDFPASRYMDTLAFGMAVNALALGWLGSRFVSSKFSGTEAPLPRPSTPFEPEMPARPRRSSKAFGVLAIAWVGVLGWGLYEITALTLKDSLPENERYFREAEAHTRAYLVTGDRANLAFDDIPYPNADLLIERVTRPSLRPLLPVSVRPPLAVQPATVAGFLENRAPHLRLNEAARHGLSPTTSPLASLPTWGSFAAEGAASNAEFKSAPLTAVFGGWLRFETAGQFGQQGLSLELHDARSGARLAVVQPGKRSEATWRPTYIRAPRQPFVIVARDTDAHRWFAFSAPVEMTAVSYWSWRIVQQAAPITWVAGGVAALLGLMGFAQYFKRRSSIPPVRERPENPRSPSAG